MKQGLIAPSMMCVDFSEMTSVIEAFEKTGIGYLHIDIMDGEFVPNYTLLPPLAHNDAYSFGSAPDDYTPG